MVSIHRLMMTYYFPYHQRIDQLIDHKEVRIAFDCHSMLPVGSLTQKDAGKSRPLICLSNNGDRRGRAKKGRIVTCPPEMIGQLADIFRDEFLAGREVAINDPFTGGFIINAHYWHKGIPFIQIEVNRSLYESEWSQDRDNEETRRCVVQLKDRIWNVLTRFWENIG
jgi:formiminoglutamase